MSNEPKKKQSRRQSSGVLRSVADILAEATRRIQDQLLLFVIVIAGLLVILAVLVNHPSSYVMFAIVGAIAVLALVVIVVPLLARARADLRQIDLDEDSKIQAAAICYQPKGRSIEFWLVKTDGGRWIFPKGRIRANEQKWEAAAREAYEEAGVSGDIEKTPLITFLHLKRGFKPEGKEMEVTAFLLRVRSTDGPTEKGRNPRWFSADDARDSLSRGRPPKYASEMVRVVDEAVRALAQK